MPVYEYECTNCENRFDVTHHWDDKSSITCSECEAPARKIFHPPAIIFKGSGFHVNDYKKSGPRAESEGNGKTKGTEDAPKTDQGAKTST